MDGRSLKPLLTANPPPPKDWRSAFMVEAATEVSGTLAPRLSGDQLPGDRRHAPREEWGRPGLEAIRTEEHLYVEYETGERELYDLREAPHKLNNECESTDPELVRHLQRRLAALRGCSGTSCEPAEDTITFRP